MPTHRKPRISTTWINRCAAPHFLVLTHAFLLASCAAAPTIPSSEERYAVWVANGYAPEVDAYNGYLNEQGVGDVVPMPSLLRSARSWQRCGGFEFSVPPRELWPRMTPTLRLVAKLRDQGLIDTRLARSVYRDEEVNRCAGGAKGSKHVQNVALDFDLPTAADNVERLCAFWREQGAEAHMGLGFYTPTAIHIDTAGYRTWGTDHTRATSLCTN
jgi:hypothetical protein